MSNVDHIEGMVLVVKSRGALSNFGEDGYSLFAPPAISAQLQDQKKAPQQPKGMYEFPLLFFVCVSIGGMSGILHPVNSIR